MEKIPPRVLTGTQLYPRRCPYLWQGPLPKCRGPITASRFHARPSARAEPHSAGKHLRHCLSTHILAGMFATTVSILRGPRICILKSLALSVLPAVGRRLVSIISTPIQYYSNEIVFPATGRTSKIFCSGHQNKERRYFSFLFLDCLQLQPDSFRIHRVQRTSDPF